MEDNVNEYDIDDDMMIITDIDDDGDMANTDIVDFGLDYTDNELDEEDDEVH